MKLLKSPAGAPASREKAYHRLRVGYYVNALSAKFGLDPETLLALTAAVRVFTQTGERGPCRVTEDSARTTPLATRAEEILRAAITGAAPPGPVRVAAGLLDACESFDNATEFAAFEGEELHAAQRELLDLMSLGDELPYAAALRKFIVPRWPLDPTSVSLPVAPKAITRLMRVDVETCSAADLESIAAIDPVLAARLLGAANSALFARDAEVTSLGAAILWLGVPLARKILWSACCGLVLASAGLKDLWQHSREVAATAHALAERCELDRDAAYVAGLLHDIGRLVVVRAPANARIAEAELLTCGFPLTYAESLLYGRDHAALGAELLARWGAPSTIVEAVARHHRPEADVSLAAVLCLAEETACGVSAPESLASTRWRAQSLRLLGLRQEDLAASNAVSNEESRFLATA